MPLVVKPNTPTAGQVIVASDTNSNLDTLYNLVNGGLETVNISASLNLPDTYLAQIVTASKVSGTAITALASLPVAAGVIPAANLPTSTSTTHYRSEMYVEYLSTTTLTVGVGIIDVSGVISKTAATTMTISTAGDWAGGVSLRATGTYGYIGLDSSGNIKLHTTAPAYSDYAVTITAGKKRYATWSGTVYRVVGWFYMNSTGSGELSSYEVSNISEHGVRNIVSRNGSTDDTINDTSYGTDMTEVTVHFYTSGGQVSLSFGAYISNTGAAVNWKYILDDGSDISNSERGGGATSGGAVGTMATEYSIVYAQGVKTFLAQALVDTSTITVSEKSLIVQEF